MGVSPWPFKRLNGGYPNNGWFVRENPSKMDDDSGYPYYRKPPNGGLRKEHGRHKAVFKTRNVLFVSSPALCDVDLLHQVATRFLTPDELENSDCRIFEMRSSSESANLHVYFNLVPECEIVYLKPGARCSVLILLRRSSAFFFLHYQLAYLKVEKYFSTVYGSIF